MTTQAQDFSQPYPESGYYEINGYRLYGGGMCPEQYDVWNDFMMVGYLRLRHGWFRADYWEVGGERVYNAVPEGDGWFMPEEREEFLRKAMAALHARLRKDLRWKA